MRVSGTNVAKLGGQKHVPCACHIGATLAKRCSRPYRKTKLPSNVLLICGEVQEGLRRLEQFVRRARFV